MHRTRRAFFIAFSLVALTGVLTGTAFAQDWLFPFSSDRASAARYRHRLDRRGPAAARHDADVPLPVPRPHLASDSKETALSAAAPTAAPASTVPVRSEPLAPREPPSTEGSIAGLPPVPAPKPVDLGGKAAVSPSPEQKNGNAVAPGSRATTAFTPRQPADDQTCFDRLVARKVDVQRTTVGPQPDSRCTVVEPVRLLGLTLADGTQVTFPDRPTIACATADAFSAYVHDLVAPLVKGSYGATLTSVGTGAGLECRARDGIAGAKLSAHGQGLAVDVAQIRLSSGRSIEVGAPKDDADKAFETAARAGGCGYFHTALGPGSDAYHRNHWHFDLLVRGKDGDDKYCK